MPVFQYQCQSCSAVFEHLFSSRFAVEPSCVNCGNGDVLTVDKPYFYPNKIFCPHDKQLDGEKLKKDLAGILVNKEQKCGGCGSDGAPGRCNSGGGGGCGSGGGCGGGCSCKSSVGGKSAGTLATLASGSCKSGAAHK